MAKTTKYIATKKIVRLNGKDYEVGQEVTGLDKKQEKRLQEIEAVTPKNAPKDEEPTNDGEADGGTDGESDGEETDK